MTRLIDADKLKFVPALIEPVLVGDESHWETIILKDRIDNAPTVDAIPIKWLTAQADNPSNSDKLRNAIDYIVYTLWAERKEE